MRILIVRHGDPNYEIDSLTEKGWIEPYGESGGRTKEYIITEEGKKIAEKELARLRELTATAAEIMGED